MNEALAVTALNEFTSWLPAELRYSARKTGYDKKLNRARLPVEDGRSMHTFLGSEWEHARLLHDQGADYAPHHGKSAQLQYAKFSAGLFDKAAMTIWLWGARFEEERRYVTSAQYIGHRFKEGRVWHNEQPVNIDTPFIETPYYDGIAAIMHDMVSVVDGRSCPADYNRLLTRALSLGSQAALSYVSFASQHLTSEQQVLPMSELAG